jgi:hypothetical protein
MKNAKLLTAFLSILLSCSKTETPNLLPVVTTNEPSGITDTSGISGGVISSDGGESVTSKGVVWSTNPTPTIADSKTMDGSGAGKFSSNILNLLPETSYFVRAYATNKNGTGYGISYALKTLKTQITDQQLLKLSKTWRITSVTLDGVDKTSLFSGFQLSITGTQGQSSFGYSATNRPVLSVWKQSGTWVFGSDPLSMIVRDQNISADKLDITYLVTGTTLQLAFSYQGAGYTRVSTVNGSWLFSFGL